MPVKRVATSGKPLAGFAPRLLGQTIPQTVTPKNHDAVQPEVTTSQATTSMSFATAAQNLFKVTQSMTTNLASSVSGSVML